MFSGRTPFVSVHFLISLPGKHGGRVFKNGGRSFLSATAEKWPAGTPYGRFGVLHYPSLSICVVLGFSGLNSGRLSSILAFGTRAMWTGFVCRFSTACPTRCRQPGGKPTDTF